PRLARLRRSLVDGAPRRRARRDAAQLRRQQGSPASRVRARENMTGAEYLPQIAMLPHVDAVITHGGNNTTTECMWFGKPMVVLPIFWDQHDNAQRIHETGYGNRLPTYAFDDAQLANALERVLGDPAIRARSTAA